MRLDLSFGIGILVTSSIAMAGPSDSKYRDAGKAAIEAAYKQTGLEQMVRALEERSLSPETRAAAGWVATGIKVVTEQQVTFKWSF